MKLCWLDVRNLDGARGAIIEEAVHQRIDGILADDTSAFEMLPPTVKRILFTGTRPLPEDLSGVDIVIADPAVHGQTAVLAAAHPEVEFGRFVEIIDAETLEQACSAARTERWSLLEFRDPTKIPLEIVIAAAAGSTGSIVTIAKDIEEAEIIFGVLEHGSDGVLLAPAAVGDPTSLKAAAQDRAGTLELVELEVTGVTHVGMGERACVDTCTYFREDEGILVGSHSKGMILCVSETHPLPYMPTRPFRVNAGAIMSYTLSAGDRTNYLSELVAGGKVLAVDVKGQTRLVTVGRVKIESRPLLSVDAIAPNGTWVNLILQDDWHVRVLGPGGVVLNSTELAPGDKVLGYLPVEDRHVGYPITEFCREQ
ncbi:3-dehydroquinate synthase II family protein [Kibdelosporangium aridum]|uniref:3-dehydroquinate synthase II family protein n=1 Tax=Kibdelosporangium aridum TaxID=2030 RepID=A0A428YCP7_KIBAR|nr:3-dehydroquinate synthase II [Kibdelosporangium aridum]RSM65250.1 3-dehydroquinate synthase II family protein [Kibdelosporangium aridum]